MKKLIPVILSGGSGKRLWPLSRESSPKPFIELAGRGSLLQMAVTRAATLRDVSDVVIVTREELYWRTRDHVESSGLQSSRAHYLLEPVGRDTASAITVATLYVREKCGKDTTMLVLSADHIIEDYDAFLGDVEKARVLAEKGFLVTFGVPPTRPDIAFGYLKKGSLIPGTEGFRVERFIEKPDTRHAEELIVSGNNFWNAGIFYFATESFLEEARFHIPEMLKNGLECLKDLDIADHRTLLHSEPFGQFPSISIDHALMEVSQRVAVIPVCFDWQDIGSWNAMAELTDNDNDGNRVCGEVFSVHTKNSYVHAPDRLVATIGIKDLLIVDTPDALLVAHKDHAQEVKRVTEHLKDIGHESYLLHRTVHRPWGTYTILEEGEGFKIKRITVKPGAKLSLQSHVHRSEHWVVIRGEAVIVNGEEEVALQMNESAFVRAGNKHRLINPHEHDELVIIETQVGVYLGEDDITRYDDQYQRT